MKSVADGKIDVGQAFKKHFDLCLACRACETACPSGVQYHPLLETAQKLIRENIRESMWVRFFKTLILRHIFPFPRRLELIFRALWLYQRSGLQKVVRVTGLLKLFSKRLDAAERFMPSIVGFSKLVNGQNGDDTTVMEKRKVGLLRGCVMDYFAPESNKATVRVLRACGCTVSIPEEQHCCGAVHMHNREHRLARECARKIIDAFEQENVPVVISNAAGCGAMLKEYGTLLSDDPDYAERAELFSAKIQDVSEFLSLTTGTLNLGTVNRTIVYDEPCHLVHGQKVSQQPRRLLQAIPGLDILPLHEAEMCCGGAGTFNITQPGLSLQILKRKMDNIRRSGAETVVTGNIGCMIQLQRGAQMSGTNLKVRHIVDILDEALGSAE